MPPIRVTCFPSAAFVQHGRAEEYARTALIRSYVELSVPLYSGHWAISETNVRRKIWLLRYTWSVASNSHKISTRKQDGTVLIVVVK